MALSQGRELVGFLFVYLLEVGWDGSQHVGKGVGLWLGQGLACMDVMVAS